MLGWPWALLGDSKRALRTVWAARGLFFGCSWLFFRCSGGARRREICCASRSCSGRYMLALLGSLGAVLGRSWAVLGQSWSGHGPSSAVLGRSLIGLERSWVGLWSALGWSRWQEGSLRRAACIKEKCLHCASPTEARWCFASWALEGQTNRLLLRDADAFSQPC